MSFGKQSFVRAATVAFTMLLLGASCGVDREFGAVSVASTTTTQPSTEAEATDDLGVADTEESEEPIRSAELPVVIHRECPEASFRIGGQDMGSPGGLRVEANDDGSQSLWTSFGDIGVEIPLVAGEPGTDLSTISESGFRLRSNDAQFEPLDGGWFIAGSLQSPESDNYLFESCLVPGPTGTRILDGLHPSDIDLASWEMFDLVSSFESLTDVRQRSDLGEYELMDVDEIIALGDGVEAQEGFALVQRIADAFNELQAAVDPDLRQQASPLFHQWSTPPVSYLLISGGGDDSIAGFVLRLDMAADVATGWVVQDASLRFLCSRGASGEFCV